jgi:UDP-N-acetylglucosamine 2-epimerase (non-hydrolysing)
MGTRPEMIKLAPVVKVLENGINEVRLVHAGQHYSPELNDAIFASVGMRPPDVELKLHSHIPSKQIAQMIDEMSRIFLCYKPDYVIVQGDTNSVLAGALAANKSGVKVAHVEAGLRSGDRFMPEEINRIVVDHISDILFAPTQQAYDLLRQEGIGSERIFTVGNTIADAVLQNVDRAEKRSKILAKLGLVSGDYILITSHRQENVDYPDRLQGILSGISLVIQDTGLRGVWPIHPRTRARLDGKEIDENIIVIPPVNFLDFLKLEKNARIILTDSGGIQEEACIMSVPCVTMRTTTERPETIQAGSNILAGISPESILKSAKEMLAESKIWKSPFGDGTSATKIMQVLEE